MNRTSGSRLALSAVAATMALASAATPAWSAPTWAPFSRYVVTLKIPEVSGTTKFLPADVNESGEVVGAVLRQAGKVWKWVRPPCYENILGICDWSPSQLAYTQYVNVFPAVWKNGVATTLPQFGGNVATWITGITDAGDYVVNTSTVAGKYPDKRADDNVRLPSKLTRILSLSGQYGEPLNQATEEPSLTVLRNTAGWLAYQKGRSADGSYPIVLTFNGASAPVAIPPEASTYSLVGLGKDGAVLLRVSAWNGEYAKGEAGRPTCFLSRQGVLASVVPTVADAVLGSSCSVLQDDGSVVGQVTVADKYPSLTSNTRTAIFAWKDGQTELLTPYIADLYRDVLINAFPALDPGPYTKVGMVVRIEVGSWGIYRNGQTINALKSAGVAQASGDRSELVGFNSAGQLLIRLIAVAKGTTSYVLLSPK
jgi:hypothetical protein